MVISGRGWMNPSRSSPTLRAESVPVAFPSEQHLGCCRQALLSPTNDAAAPVAQSRGIELTEEAPARLPPSAVAVITEMQAGPSPASPSQVQL